MKRSTNTRQLQALLGVGLLFGLSGLSGWNIGMKEVEAFHIDKGETFQTTLTFPYTTLSIALEADNDLPCPIAARSNRFSFLMAMTISSLQAFHLLTIPVSKLVTGDCI